jgi:hypothetical protein
MHIPFPAQEHYIFCTSAAAFHQDKGALTLVVFNIVIVNSSLPWVL